MTADTSSAESTPQHDVGIVDGAAQFVVAVVLVDLLPREDALVVPDQLPQGATSAAVIRL